MTKTTTSPLRQRMLDDMALRKLSEQTQRAYIRAVERFTRFFGQSPELASPEDLRRFQMHLVAAGCLQDHHQRHHHRTQVPLRGDAGPTGCPEEDAAR